MRLVTFAGIRRSDSAGTEQSRAWGRRSLLGFLLIVVLGAVVLLVGLGYAIYLAITDVAGVDEKPVGLVIGESGATDRPRGLAHRNEIAAARMLEVPEAAMFPTATTDGTAPRIDVPVGTRLGPALVTTGFPPSPEGAIGQLAEIDVAALQATSPQVAQEIYLNWALPGGVGPRGWRITTGVGSFLDASGMGKEKDPRSQVIVEPAAALVKGTDGRDWVVACVLLKVTASYRQDGEVAFGHCERMQWVGGRWMLAPGEPPAPAPSTWPGTALAHAAGWLTWHPVAPPDARRGAQKGTPR